MANSRRAGHSWALFEKLSILYWVFGFPAGEAAAPVGPAIQNTIPIPGVMLSSPVVPSFDQMMIQSQQLITQAACFTGAYPGANTSSMASCGNDELGEQFSSSDPAAICDQLVGADGIFNPMALQQRMMQVNMAMQAISCEQSQFAMIQGQLDCLRQKSTMMGMQVASLQKAFQANIQQMQTDVRQIKDAQEDRAAQIQSVDNMLKGSNGNPGLLEQQKTLEGLVNNTIPQEMAQVQQQMDSLNSATKALNDTILYQKMTTTSQCFNQQTMLGGGQAFRCEPNGPPVSAREYILCRYEQNQLLGQGGVIEKDALVAKQAQARREALAALLDSIWSNTYQSAQNDPKNPQQSAMNVTTAMNQGVLIQSPADVDKYFGDKLGAYNGKGLDIRAFVNAMAKKCYSLASQVVEAKRTRPTTDIGSMVVNLQQQQKSLKEAMNVFVEKYSQAFEAGMRALTGNPMPLPGVDVCKNAAPAIEFKCMKDIRTNLEGLLTGRTQQSSTNIIVRGTKQQTYIPVKCSGINGCIRVLGNVQDSLNLEKSRLDSFLKNYVLAAYQRTETFGISMAQQLSPQSQNLTQQLNALNSRLASLGLQGVTLKTYQSEPLQKDEDGLPIAPRDVLAFIGGQMVPPLIDLGGDAFSGVTDGIKSKQDEVKQKMAKAQNAMQALMSAQGACKRQQANNLQQKLSASLGGLDQCYQSYSWCENFGEEKIGDLMNAMNDAGLDANSDGSDVSAALQAGMGQCARIKSQYQDARDELARIQKDLTDARDELSHTMDENERDALKSRINQLTGELNSAQQSFRDYRMKDNYGASCSALTNQVEKQLNNFKNFGSSDTGSSFIGM